VRPGGVVVLEVLGQHLSQVVLIDDEQGGGVPYAGLLRDLARVLQPRLANAPRMGRRRRIIATVLLLGDDAPPEEAT
jgi:hypothetical protein